MIYFQDIILRLSEYWAKNDCILFEPYNSEVGAGTFNPATFLRVLDEKDYRVAYVEPSKRPRDGRYGKNPLRVQQFWQYQVILQPAPEDVLKLYIKSLKYIGIEPEKHDLKFTEDDWESPTLGAWGLGWQVELDGIEITQFTYFQEVGGIALKNIPAEITYGLERIAIFLQDAKSIFDIKWNSTYTWGDIFLRNEQEFSQFNFEEANVKMLEEEFNNYEREAFNLVEKGLVLPAYDYTIKSSHIFNLLEARGAISVSERAKYIGRIRRLAKKVAETYRDKNETGYN